MNLMITTSGVDDFRRFLNDNVDGADAAQLALRLQRAARQGIDSPEFNSLIQLARRRDDDVYLARFGNLRALLTYNPNISENITLVKLYRASEDEGAALEDAIREVGDGSSISPRKA